MNKHRIGALIAAAALTLTFAVSALATEFTWGGNGYPNATCDENSSVMQWVWTGDSPTSLTINGQVQSGSWAQKGGGAWQFQADINGTNYPPTSASIDYTGDDGTLTLSGCDEHTTTTTTTTTTTAPETSSTTTTTTTTTTTSSVSIETQCTNCSDTSTTTSSTTNTNSINTLVTTSDTTANDTPDGSVEELTPPSTDTIGAATSSSSVSTSLLLVLAGVLATALVVIPAAARKRR